MEDIPDVAFQSIYKVLGGYPIYKQNTWSVNNTADLINLGIINEYSVYPYQSAISREEFFNLLYNVYSYLKDNPSVNYTDSFLDTDNINILKLKSLGIINGTASNKINPDDTISREQACTAIGKMLSLLGYSNKTNNVSFSDSSNISSWAKAYVQLVSGIGIIKGIDGKFMPKRNLTMEEALVIFDRTIKINILTDGTYPVRVIGAFEDKGDCYLQFKTIIRYDCPFQYLEKVDYDMELYYKLNYPVDRYKNGEKIQIPIQNVCKETGLTKSEIFDKMSIGGSDDNNLLFIIDNNISMCKLSNSCQTELCSVNSIGHMILGNQENWEISSVYVESEKELVEAINKVLKQYEYFRNEGIYNIKIVINNNVITKFSEYYSD